MSDPPDWRSRTSRRVRMDTQSGRVGYVVEETETEVRLRLLMSNWEWSCPVEATRPADPDEVAAALMDE